MRASSVQLRLLGAAVVALLVFGPAATSLCRANCAGAEATVHAGMHDAAAAPRADAPGTPHHAHSAAGDPPASHPPAQSGCDEKSLCACGDVEQARIQARGDEESRQVGFATLASEADPLPARAWVARLSMHPARSPTGATHRYRNPPLLI